LKGAALRRPAAHGASRIPIAQSWQDAVLPRQTEAGAAAWLREQGRVVVEHKGRYWVTVVPGFYQAVHLLARFRADEATCPSPWSWGFRARLAPEEAAAANATVSVHLLPDLAGYCAARLSSERRRKLRKGLSELDVVALRAPDILLEQGYGVALEAKGFSPGLRLAGPAAFRRWIMSYFAPERGLIVAGLEGGRLLGFCTNFAIDGTAYQDMLYVGAEGRRRHLALCLFHCSASIAGRDASVGELMNGLHMRERPGVSAFKRGLGLEVVCLPTRVWIAPLFKPLLRRSHPEAYRRLGLPT
jgi:hypothetical protein